MRKKGDLKMQASPVMLLKTNGEKMSLWASPVMCMKTKQLTCRYPTMCMKTKEINSDSISQMRAGVVGASLTLFCRNVRLSRKLTSPINPPPYKCRPVCPTPPGSGGSGGSRSVGGGRKKHPLAHGYSISAHSGLRTGPFQTFSPRYLAKDLEANLVVRADPALGGRGHGQSA